MSIDFRSDPVSQRFQGWTPTPGGQRTRLVPGWEPRPEYGAGAEPDPDLTARLGGAPLPTDLPAPPFDWGAIRSAVFPEGLPEPAPEPDPTPTPVASVEADPGLQAHLGGKPVPKPAVSVYDPSQARVLSSPASPVSKPPARPPSTPTSAQVALRAASGGTGPHTPNQQQFVDSLLPTAQAVGKQTGIPWQVLMAIPANETGWGSSVFHNNYFGMKGPGAPAKTWEVINGKRQDITDSFQTFDSPEASMKGFAQLMQNPRYQPAMAQLQKDPTNWPAFVSMIHTAGYATDPNWAQKVISIGQGMENADTVPHHADMSTVTPKGSLLDTARSAISGAKPGDTSAGTDSGGMVFPVKGFTGKVQDHWGEVKGGSDLFAPRGTPVSVMEGGKVIESGYNSIGGNAVLIQGNDGLQYYYAHGDAAPSVKVGDTVSAGTYLMPVGDTGDAKGKGTHLHMGIGPDIKLGADKYGGTGGDYNAVGLLQTTLDGKPTDTSKGGGAPATKGSYTDDASYVAWTYRNGLGRNLPSTVGGLYVSSKPIKASDAVPGDLVMYNMSGDPSQQHVAIYAGNGKMIHDNGEVSEEPLWAGGEFRRLSGVKPSDLTSTAQPNTPPQEVSNPIVKYVSNPDGTYTATHRDGSTSVERSLSALAPVEGGLHPRTIGQHPSSMRPPAARPGSGQEEGGVEPDPDLTSHLSGTPRQADPDLGMHLGNQVPVVRNARDISYWTSEGTHGGHPAADIFADPGTPIYAPVGGNAVPGTFPLGGNAVTLQGDDGKWYYMAHGKVPFTGGRVEANQPFGQVGNTGDAKYTDAHVHMGVATDPALFDKWNGSGDVEGGPEYWTVGEKMGTGAEADPDLAAHLGGAPDPPMDTYYHGTGSEFDKADPDALLGSNLYGPGYYVTSSPSVAGGEVEGGDPNSPDYNPTFALPTLPRGVPAPAGLGMGQDVPETAPAKKRPKPPSGSPLEQALRAMIEEAVSARMGAGADGDEEDIPWWDRARQAAQDAASGVVGGVQDAAQGLVTQATAPVQLAPGQTTAAQDIAGAPQVIGNAFDQLGTTVQDVLPTPEQQDKSWVPAPPPPARKPIAPAAPAQPPTPPEDITPTSPLTADLAGAAQSLQPTPPPAPAPTIGPTLQPDNPIMQAARGETVNPLEWNEAVGRAAAQTVVPEPIRQASVDLPIVGKVTGEDVAAQVLSPGALINAVAGGPAESTALGALGRLGQGPVEEAINLAAGKVGSVALEHAAPVLGKVADPAIAALAEHAVPAVQAAANSPVGKFMLEESGAVGPVTALKIVRDGVIGTQVGGAIGVAGDLRNPRTDDPLWWSQVQDDYANGAKIGGIAAMGIPGAKYGLEKSITPETMRWFNNVVNPRMAIKDVAAQIAAGTRANMLHQAQVGADIVKKGGEDLFGKPGQGLNTAEAAAYAETKRTLVGFTAKDGSRVTPDQENWLQERIAYEDAAQARLAAAKVLGPTQNVVTSGSEPGPKVHITGLYEPDVAADKLAANRGRGGGGFGWRDSTIIKPRGKTVDPSIDPNTPRTIAESIAENVRDAVNNPKPLDDLVSRFEVSAYQTERTLANREFYATINPVGKARIASPSVRPAKIAPDDWVFPEDKWGFGSNAKKFKFEPTLATYMNNVSGVTQSPPWLDWFGEHVASPLKGLLFGGSTVHAFNVGYRVISTMDPIHQTPELIRQYILPAVRGGYGDLMMDKPALALDAAAHGLTPARAAAEGIDPQWGVAGNLARTAGAAATGWGAGFTQAKARGESDEEAFRQGLLGAGIATPMALPGLGAGIVKVLGKDVDVNAAASFADVLHHAIFKEGMPAAKLGMYDMLVKTASNGGKNAVTDAQKEMFATSINNTIGGIDQLKMGRSPWAQDLARYGLIASDWTEGQVKTMANLFMPNQMGAHTRASIAKGLGSYMAGIEAMNIIANGHPTWENGDGNEFKLEVTGLLNGTAHLLNNPGLASVDPTDKTPTRTFVDPMPPLRWMLETIHEAAREGVYTAGQAEQMLPGGQAAGQRLMDFTGQNLAKGELPPNLPGKLGSDIEQRIGPGPGALGAVKEALERKQKDWTGKPLDPPDFSTPTGWAEWAGHLVAPMAPATTTSVLSNVDVAHPSWRAYAGDTLAEALGFTRVNRTKELSDNLAAVDRIKTEFLGNDPAVVQHNEDTHQAQIATNDKLRTDLFSTIQDPDSKVTHAEADSKLHSFTDARKALSRRNQIREDYTSKAPAWAQDTVQHLLENAWNVTGSPTPADLNPTTDINELAQTYWAPPGVDVTDQKALSQARNNLLRDFAVAHNEDPSALEDHIKWQAQNQDDLSKATPPIKALPGVTSGELGTISTDYLQSGEDEHGNLIDDVNVRGDKMRAFLKDSAKQLSQESGQTVSPEDLLTRINLRLSPVAQSTPIEKSYNTALQTFFTSRDEDQFPRYKNPDGSPMGDRAKWDLWDAQINSLGQANARKSEEWQPRVEAKELASNDRDKWLLQNANRPDYERWFGIGRGMNERQWQEYRSGTGPVGYEDLSQDADLKPPFNETARRDRIQAQYRASNRQERADNDVQVWVQGEYVPMNLNAAERYIRHFQVNQAGRTLEDLAAHDEADPKVRPSLRLDTVEAAANATQ